MADAESTVATPGVVVGVALVILGTGLNVANTGGSLGTLVVIFGAAVLVEGWLRGI